jgi:hypothetical protein
MSCRIPSRQARRVYFGRSGKLEPFDIFVAQQARTAKADEPIDHRA